MALIGAIIKIIQKGLKMLSVIALVSVLHDNVTIKKFYPANDSSDKVLNVALDTCKAQRKVNDRCMLASPRSEKVLVLTDLQNLRQIVLNR